MSSMGTVMYQAERGAGTRRGAERHTRSASRVPEGTLSVAREATGEDETAPRHLELPGPAQIRHAAAHLGARAHYQLREVGLRERQIDEHARRIRLPKSWARTSSSCTSRSLSGM